MSKRKGFLRSDGDGHWYLIPKSELKDFQEQLNRISTNIYSAGWEDAVEDFVSKFDVYRLSGGVESLEITINE